MSLNTLLLRGGLDNLKLRKPEVTVWPTTMLHSHSMYSKMRLKHFIVHFVLSVGPASFCVDPSFSILTFVWTEEFCMKLVVLSCRKHWSILWAHWVCYVNAFEIHNFSVWLRGGFELLFRLVKKCTLFQGTLPIFWWDISNTILFVISNICFMYVQFKPYSSDLTSEWLPWVTVTSG